MVVLLLGIVSLFAPIPRTERAGFKADGMSAGVAARHDDKVSPLVCAVMILGGAGTMAAGKMKS
jgi:hypothetical protein